MNQNKFVKRDLTKILKRLIYAFVQLKTVCKRNRFVKKSKRQTDLRRKYASVKIRVSVKKNKRSARLNKLVIRSSKKYVFVP